MESKHGQEQVIDYAAQGRVELSWAVVVLPKILARSGAAAVPLHGPLLGPESDTFHSTAGGCSILSAMTKETQSTYMAYPLHGC